MIQLSRRKFCIVLGSVALVSSSYFIFPLFRKGLFGRFTEPVFDRYLNQVDSLHRIGVQCLKEGQRVELDSFLAKLIELGLPKDPTSIDQIAEFITNANLL